MLRRGMTSTTSEDKTLSAVGQKWFRLRCGRSVGRLSIGRVGCGDTRWRGAGEKSRVLTFAGYATRSS